VIELIGSLARRVVGAIAAEVNEAIRNAGI
jgi:hypothetical protein